MISKNKLFIGLIYTAGIFPSLSQAASWISVTELVSTMQQGMSALNVATKQAALAANQQSLAAVNAFKMLSTSRGAVEMSNRLIDTFSSFDASTGQASSNGCVAHMQNSLSIQADELAESNRAALMQTYVTKRYGAQSMADNERLNMHRDTYCSASEAKSGACTIKANGMQGWDTDYAGAFNQPTLSPEAELAGYAYIANLTDHRIAVSQDCQSIACQAATLTQMRSSAFDSMVADSLVGQLTERRIPEIKAVQ